VRVNGLGRAPAIYLQPDAKDPVLADATVLQTPWPGPHVDRRRSSPRSDESGGEARATGGRARRGVKTQRPHRVRPRTSLARSTTCFTYLSGPLGGPHPGPVAEPTCLAYTAPGPANTS